MDHRKVRKIYWICWLLASVIVVLGALLPDEKMQKIVIAIGIIIVIFGNIIAIWRLFQVLCKHKKLI